MKTNKNQTSFILSSDVLGGKISDEKKRKLELFLINSPLDEKQKSEIIDFIRSVI